MLISDWSSDVCSSDLFNKAGDVIGINTAIFSQSGGSIGIGFAVPANLARPVVLQLIEYGRTRRGWLGVQIQSVTDEMVDALGLKQARGALVAKAIPGGPAAKDGRTARERVVALPGKPVEDPPAGPRTQRGRKKRRRS